MKVIDLRSDTISLPTVEMRKAMYRAELGDDVFKEDPTVNRLEELAAVMMGKEASLFTPSGTMSNLLAVLSNTKPGDEIILGSEAHMLWYEVGGAAAIGGVVMRNIKNNKDGTISLSLIQEAIRESNLHFPTSKLVCLENTHNRCGGRALTVEYTNEVCKIAQENKLLVHLDGARIFNAAVALDIPVVKLVENVDSVCFCLSKSLCSPVGSLLCGDREYIQKARKLRKMLGGGMRQSGVLASAGIVALQQGVDRLIEDHKTAKQLAWGLNEIDGLTIELDEVQTNIIVFEVANGLTAANFIEQMNKEGVKFTQFGRFRVRAVTSRMVISEDITEALKRINRFMSKTNEKHKC
jgi:threonine aldolase